MNTDFTVKNLPLEGAKLITPFYVEDDRGFFLKSVEKDIFENWGLKADIYEDFESFSHKGVIRGLHFQIIKPQVKMVRAILGTICDVIVDLRKDSSTFGQYTDIILSDENHEILWIPEGFAHGFEVLSDTALVSYKCIGKYIKEYDTGIVWNDPEIGIMWSTSKPIISDRDAELMSFHEFKEKHRGF